MADPVGLDTGSALTSAPVLQLLQNAIGGVTDTSGTKNGTSAQTGTVANTQAGNTTNTTQSTADTTDLQKVFAQQQAGITPEMLAAIFTQGSKAAPGLIAANANAVGARSSDNTPLATALTGLNAQLTNQAATLDLQQKNASADTAAKIAQLTAGTTSTGTNNTTNNQTSQNNGTTTDASGQTTSTQPNYQNVQKLLGMLLGGSALNSGLSNVGGIAGAAGAGTDAIGNLMKALIPGLGAQAGGDTSTGVDVTPADQINAGQFGTSPASPSLGGAAGFGTGADSGLEALMAQFGLSLNGGKAGTGAGTGTGGSEGESGNLASDQVGAISYPVNAGGDPTSSNVAPVVEDPDWWSSEGWADYFGSNGYDGPGG